MQQVWEYLVSLEWQRLIPELLGKALGFALGFAASWFLLFRQRLKQIERFQQGDSDDLIYQFHKLVPMENGEVALMFRNVGEGTTVNKLYDNPAARDLVKGIADKTSIANPVLATEGSGGFEVLNTAFSYVAGLLALTPFPRDIWLFAMTCEDRQLVRKKCIRCFLIRAADLERFLDWNWCCTKVRVERPWHWFRVVALHQIAQQWRLETGLSLREKQTGEYHKRVSLMVDRQVRHNRIKEMSAGLNPDEKLVAEPVVIDWATHAQQLRQLGLKLEMPASSEPRP